MTKSCPGCGATAPAEARYCRHCGTALRVTGTSVGAETISPLANTEPLGGLPFATGELNAPESRSSAELTDAPDPELTADLSTVGAHDVDSGEITIPVVRGARVEQTATSASLPAAPTQPAAVSAQTFAAPAPTQTDDAAPAQVVPMPPPKPAPAR